MFYLSALLPLLCGLLMILDYAATFLVPHSSPVFFKAEAALWALTFWMVPFSALAARVKWNDRLEVLTAVNFLYAFCLCFWPYEVFLVGLFKLGIVLQLANLFAFLYFLIHSPKQGRPQYGRPQYGRPQYGRPQYGRMEFGNPVCASVFLFFALDILYWLGFLFPSGLDLTVPLMTSILLYALASGCLWLRSRGCFALKGGARGPRHRKPPGPADVSGLETAWGTASGTAVGTVPGSSRETALGRPQLEKAVDADLKALLAAEEQSEAEIPPAPLSPEDRSALARLLERVEIGDRLWNAISVKCDGPYHHLFHVSAYTRLLCGRMGISEERAGLIADAALLHDIGKLRIPRSILLKTEKLTEEEFGQIKKHHIYGYDLLAENDDAFSRQAAEIAREHHEHMDGTGYLGLGGKAISLPARIVSVADVFDALTSPRGYKKTWTFEQAFSYVEEHDGIYFDPDVVAALREARPQFLSLYAGYREQMGEQAK